MKKLIITIVAALVGISSYGQAVPFVNIPGNAGQLGVAGATVADYVKDGGDIRATYGSWAPKNIGSKVFGVDAAFKFGKVGFSIDGKFFNDPEMITYDDQGVSTGKFSPKESYFGAGFSYWIADAFSIGAKARLISSNLYKDAKANAFAADVELKYVKNGFSAGAAVCNLGGKVKYGTSSTENSLPTIAKVGAKYRFEFGLSGAAEADYLFAGGLMAALGLEYSIKEIGFVRLGYHYGNETKAIPSYVSAGLGVKIKGICLDAAYLLGSKTLGNTLMISLGYSFQSNKRNASASPATSSSKAGKDEGKRVSR